MLLFFTSNVRLLFIHMFFLIIASMLKSLVIPCRHSVPVSVHLNWHMKTWHNKLHHCLFVCVNGEEWHPWLTLRCTEWEERAFLNHNIASQTAVSEWWSTASCKPSLSAPVLHTHKSICVESMGCKCLKSSHLDSPVCNNQSLLCVCFGLSHYSVNYLYF